MPKKLLPIKGLRVPEAVDGIQVNHCKNPACKNFGVPAKPRINRSRHAQGARSDNYRLIGKGGGTRQLYCLDCRETPPIKSNLAVSEERDRMLQYLQVVSPTCPESTCSNHAVPLSTPRAYQSFGSTAAGSARYRCNACQRLFSIARKSGLRQREPHKNRLVFSLLINKSPMRRICEVADIAPKTLYQRIGFFHAQCLGFAAARERKLLNGMKLDRLYVAVDRQDYIINWSNQSDRRNVQLHAVASADDTSGYVFGMHLDFDSTLDNEAIELDAAQRGDLELLHPYRRYARLWLRADYNDGVREYRRQSQRSKRKAIIGTDGVIGDVEATYQQAQKRSDVEVEPTQNYSTQLPIRGMQTHSEYTLYGHFYFLERLFRNVGKVRFLLDQDSGIRAACLAAFKDRVIERKADAFFVRINKELTINERRAALKDSRAEFARAQKANPKLSDRELALHLIQQRVAVMKAVGKWSDRWLLHPFPSMSEPDKAICYLTDFHDYAPDHLARLYQRASLHSIDRFFMQVRRKISLLERPIKTASSEGRSWYGYSPYNPEMVTNMLDIFRVAYNYVIVGEDKKTPAMRLGLARAPLDIEDIIYFKA